MYFALDGVACCYKTSTLKELHTEGCDVEFTSFAAFMERIGDFPSKSEMASFWYGMIRLGSGHREGCIYDRHPASALLYQIIHNDPNIEDVQLDKLFDMFKPLMQNWKMIIVVPNNADKVVERMKERNNGLDIIDVDYVKNQTRIFRAFAKKFDVMVADVEQDALSSIQSIKILIHTALFGNIVVMGGEKKLADKPYPFDAGIDLHVKEDVSCEVGKATRVILSERIIIPAGYVGFMYPRSSTALNLGDVRTGVIDPFYSNELSCPFVADKRVVLTKGQRIAQIIIMRSTFPPIVHCPDVKLIHMDDSFRGGSGYGSSGV